MGSFILVQYGGPDAADVLARVLAGIGENEEVGEPGEHEVESETTRVVGFAPSPEPEVEETPDEPDKPGESYPI